MSQSKPKTVADFHHSPDSQQYSSKSRTKMPKMKHSNNRKLKKVPPQNSRAVVNKPIPKETTDGASVSKEAEIAKINLKILQKVDSRIECILATVPHVVLYKFREEENIWVSSS